MILDIFGVWWQKSEIFADYNLFLFGIALFWLLVASIQDLRKREVENWWNFSLVIFALVFKAILSVKTANPMYFIWGLIGLGVGFVLANAFYYGRLFAGGDAKLLIGLCIILMPSLDWGQNLLFIVSFLVTFLMVGAIYGLIYSFVLAMINFNLFRKEFKKQFKLHKKLFFVLTILFFITFLIFLVISFSLGVILSIILLISPLLLIYAKAIEESAMVKLVLVKDLTIGDWVIETIKLRMGSKIRLIKPDWQGLSEEELKIIQKKFRGKKVLVKNGIPFVPAFLMGFILLLLGIFFSIL